MSPSPPGASSFVWLLRHHRGGLPTGPDGAVRTVTAVSQEKGLLQQWGPEGPPLALEVLRAWGSGFSSVAVSGERIFTMGDKDGAQHVFALPRGTAARCSGRRAVGPTFEDRRGGSRSTPVVDGQRVFALGSDGDLVCLDAASGKQLSGRKNLERDYGGQMMSSWAFSESPLVDGDRVLFTPGGPRATSWRSKGYRRGNLAGRRPRTRRAARTAPPTRRSSCRTAAA